MTAHSSDRRALAFLSTLIVAGIATVAIPWFLTAPAYLDLALRDTAFDSDLSARNVVLTDDGNGTTKSAAIERAGEGFVAHLGRIRSGTGTYTARVTGYRPAVARFDAAATQTVRVPLELTPEFGRIELSTFNAMRGSEPVAAMLRDGSRRLTTEPQRVVTIDLLPGRHLLSAEASGFCASERAFEVQAGQITQATVALSPQLAGDEIARFVFGWHNSPNDLDTHFWKSDARFPSAQTVYYDQKIGKLPNGQAFASLDVDEVQPGRYETLSVRNSAIGEYRYLVKIYEGDGTIAGSDASVQVYTRGCQVRTFTPPSNCTSPVWNVANLRYDGNRVALLERQRCEADDVATVRKSGP
jgi:hypothetical protein